MKQDTLKTLDLNKKSLKMNTLHGNTEVVRLHLVTSDKIADVAFGATKVAFMYLA